jgi:hypothetical protein
VKNVFIIAALLSVMALSTHSPAREYEMSRGSLGMITYVKNGDLWIRELPGREAKLLVRGYILEPRFLLLMTVFLRQIMAINSPATRYK